MDPASGKIVSIIKMTARAGTAYDGRHLYQLAGPSIQKVDPRSGEILATLPAPAEGCSGMAWAEGALWVAHYRERKIHKIDPATGKILRTIASDRYVTGVTWTNGGLWHGTWENDESELRRVSPETGECRRACSCRRASTSPGWKRATACSIAAAAPAAGSAPCASPSPRPKAAERTPPPESGGGASRLAPRPSASWSRPRPALRPQGNQASSRSIRPPPPWGPLSAAPACKLPFWLWWYGASPSAHRFQRPDARSLLARLTDVDVPESGQSLSDRLSLWLGWTDAIALAAVLDGKPPAMAPGGPTFDSEQDRKA